MITAKQVREKLSEEDIIKLCCFLQGNDIYYTDSQGRPLFNTCIHHEHGDSYKLVYFPDSKMFYCYTRGTSCDVFDLVKFCTGIDELPAAIDYVCKFFNITDLDDETRPYDVVDDWDIFQKIEDYDERSALEKQCTPVQENLLEYYYPLAAPTEWLKEGISAEVMLKFGIRVDAALQKIIIPHRDINGKLVGIRGRTFNIFELDNGLKYMPVCIEGTYYAHPLGLNLYGLYENKETIKRMKKVVVFEAEKSVMQCASMYPESWAVATCGSNLSQEQIDLLLGLGVEEVILAYDKEYDGNPGDNDYEQYLQKLIKQVSYLSSYVNTYIIMDDEGLLGHKDSPSDRGKETFEKLLKSKKYIPPFSIITSKRKKSR